MADHFRLENWWSAHQLCAMLCFVQVVDPTCVVQFVQVSDPRCVFCLCTSMITLDASRSPTSPSNNNDQAS
eukprot:5009386-Pyramimonas_sp.AAC.1